jgi:hypothetical protein
MVRLDFVLADLQRDLAILERYGLDYETGTMRQIGLRSFWKLFLLKYTLFQSHYSALVSEVRAIK